MMVECISRAAGARLEELLPARILREAAAGGARALRSRYAQMWQASLGWPASVVHRPTILEYFSRTLERGGEESSHCLPRPAWCGSCGIRRRCRSSPAPPARDPAFSRRMSWRTSVGAVSGRYSLFQRAFLASSAAQPRALVEIGVAPQVHHLVERADLGHPVALELAVVVLADLATEGAGDPRNLRHGALLGRVGSQFIVS